MIESSLFLERRDYGLGQDFLDAVQRCEEKIASDPEIGQPWQENTQKCAIRRFPYCIIYREEEKHIMIYAVASFSREPDYWIERLP